MTYVYNDPAEFKNDVIRGFAAAYPQYVQRVPDASGFVRVHRSFHPFNQGEHVAHPQNPGRHAIRIKVF